MRFHHVALVVTDIDASLTVYRDLLGLRVLADVELPDGPGEGRYFDGPLLDEIFGVRGSRSRMVILGSREGVVLELQQPRNPPVRRTPDEYRGYGWSGIAEVAFAVEDIDDWFARVRDAGHVTQTAHVWEYAGLGRSFLFHDPDGNLVQLNEELAAS